MEYKLVKIVPQDVTVFTFGTEESGWTGCQVDLIINGKVITIDGSMDKHSLLSLKEEATSVEDDKVK